MSDSLQADTSIEYVDYLRNVGQYASLELDSYGSPHISYYDSTNGDLKYAYFDGYYWQPEIVDNTGDVGQYSSLALDSYNRPHISYYDYTNGDLRYAYFDGTSWQLYIVDNTGDVGQYTSLALDSYNRPHISYYDYTNGDLRYAYFDGTSWQLYIVDNTGDVGQYTSLALDSYNRPHISYYDYTNGDLRYAYFDDTSWQLYIVDNTGDVGQYTSLALDSFSRPHIAYHDFSGGSLKYSYYDGSFWQLQVIDTMGNNILNPYKSKAHIYKGQIHLHSTNSDGIDSPYNLVEGHKNNGFDFVAISDHNRITPDPNVPGITNPISNVEESVFGKNGEYHINTLGKKGSQNNSLDPQKVIDDVVADGGIAMVNHPKYVNPYGLGRITDEELLYWENYSLLEIQAAGGNSEDKWDMLLSNGRKIWGTSDSDCHGIIYNYCWERWIRVNADDLSSSSIMDSLKNGNFYATTGNALSVSLDGSTMNAAASELSTIDFIGKYGQILKRQSASTSSSYTLEPTDDYVRVRIKGNVNYPCDWSNTLCGWSNPFFVLRNITSLVLDSSGKPHISYYDYVNGKLKYAHSDGVLWSLDTIDSQKAGRVGFYADIVLDADGDARFSYYNGDDLKFIKHFMLYCPPNTYDARIIGSTSSYYPTVQSAYNAAADGDIIQVRSITLNEQLNFNRNISVEIEGGFNCDFSSKAGITTINGNMNVTNNKISVSGLKMQ